MRTRTTEPLLRSALGLALLLGVTATPARAQLNWLNFGGSDCCDTCCETECCEEECCDDVCCDTCCDWCNLGDPWALNDHLWPANCECSEPPFVIAGWTQIGYHTNANGMFNDHPHRVNLHQQYLYAERVADGTCGPDWGFRADLLYGVDAQNTQAFFGEAQHWDSPWDNGIYGWAIPQLYAEFATGDLSVKMGKFYTPVGYELVTAPGNFFYSHAYTHNFSEPFTHTGVLATYAASDAVTLYGGWVDGWDTGFEFTGGSQFLGGFSVAASDNVTVTYIFLAGDREVGGGGQGYTTRANGYNHSVVVDFALSDNLNYIVQSDFVDYNEIDQHQYGLNNYLLYWYNDCLGFGTRAEWWHTNESFFGLGDGSEDIYAVTAGMNIKPHANVVFRPEVRYDWNESGAINNLNGETTFGVDAIVTY